MAAAFIALLVIAGMAESTELPTAPCDAHGQSSGLPYHATYCLVVAASVGSMYALARRATPRVEKPAPLLHAQTGTVFRI